MKVYGKTTRCMAMESLLGQMEEGTKETMWKTRNKEREHSTGLMEGNILEIGSMVNNMEEVHL